MRDFTADRRLMQQAPASAGASSSSSLAQQRLQAAQNRYNVAKTSGDKAGMEAATREVIQVASENGLLDVAMNGAGTLARTALEIQADRAKKRVEAAQQATNTDLQLQAQRGNTVISAEGNATNSIFNAKMIVPQMMQQGIAGIKMMETYVCAIAKLFGTELDTSGFDKYLDDLQAKIKWPTTDTSRIEDVNTTVTSDAGSDRMDRQANDSISALSQDQTELNNMIGRISAGLDAKNGGGARAAAPVAGNIQTSAVSAGVKALKDNGSISANVDVTAVAGAVSRADANKDGILAPREQQDLRTRLEPKIGAHDADMVNTMIQRAVENHRARTAAAPAAPAAAPAVAVAAPAGPAPQPS